LGKNNVWTVRWKYRQTDSQPIGGEDTFLLLSRTELEAETESETKTAQDHDLPT